MPVAWERIQCGRTQNAAPLPSAGVSTPMVPSPTHPCGAASPGPRDGTLSVRGAGRRLGQRGLVKSVGVRCGCVSSPPRRQAGTGAFRVGYPVCQGAPTPFPPEEARCSRSGRRRGRQGSVGGRFGRTFRVRFLARDALIAARRRGFGALVGLFPHSRGVAALGARVGLRRWLRDPRELAPCPAASRAACREHCAPRAADALFRSGAVRAGAGPGRAGDSGRKREQVEKEQFSVRGRGTCCL